VTTDHELVDTLDEVWTSIDAFAEGLDEAGWKQPTELPGWTVQDTLAHLGTLELMLLGRPVAGTDVAAGLPHVKNDIGLANERVVESRRPWTGAAVHAEFHAATRERVAWLRGLDADGFGAAAWTPRGPGTVRVQLGFRIFDSWVHEQDMRRAVGRPGGLDGRGAAHCLGMMAEVMPFVVGKKAGAPDGCTVVFALEGPCARDVAVGVVGGRAALLDERPASPTVTLGMGTETFARLATGRLGPAGAVDAGAVVLGGDDRLGRRVLAEMNYLF